MNREALETTGELLLDLGIILNVNPKEILDCIKGQFISEEDAGGISEWFDEDVGDNATPN